MISEMFVTQNLANGETLGHGFRRSEAVGAIVGGRTAEALSHTMGTP